MGLNRAKLESEGELSEEKYIEEEKLLEYEQFDEIQNTIEQGTRSQYLAKHIGTTQTEAYNPDQDKREILEIRRSYAHLREELNRNNRELVQADSNRLSELIDQSNVVFGRVHTTFDASLDSRFITDTADLGVEKVHKLPLFVSEFSLDTYLRIMKQYLNGCNWDDLGDLLSSHWIGVETADFMLGSMNLEVKKRAVNPTQSRATREAVAPVVKPTVVNLAEKENTTGEISKETSENVMKVFAILSEIGSFPFYHFITDPQSLSRTIENLFYVSFLVRDNRVRIFIPEVSAESNELYIEAIDPDDDENGTSDENNQLVLVMSTKTWRKAIEKYNIENAFLSFSPTQGKCLF